MAAPILQAVIPEIADRRGGTTIDKFPNEEQPQSGATAWQESPDRPIAACA